MHGTGVDRLCRFAQLIYERTNHAARARVRLDCQREVSASEEFRSLPVTPTAERGRRIGEWVEAAAATGNSSTRSTPRVTRAILARYSGISLQSQSRNGSFAWSTIGPAVERMGLGLTMNVDGHAQA